MQLAEIRKVARIGSLVDAQANSAEFLAELGQEALRVEQRDVEFVAATATSAAAWLLELANVNALGEALHRPRWEPPARDCFRFSSNCLIGFRGQRAEYRTIIPSIYRKSEPEQTLRNSARVAFHAALSAWHNTYFRYADSTLHDFGGVELWAAIGAAQHYGLGTFLIDWTWDPLVAIAFALEGLSPGETGAVYLCNWDPLERSAHTVNLAPPFLKRVLESTRVLYLARR